MNTSPAAGLRRRVAGVSMIVAPVLLLTSSVLRFVLGLSFEWYLTMKLSFFFFALAALGLLHLLRGRADGSGHVGAAMALGGCISGASIVTAAYIIESIQGRVPEEQMAGLYLTIVNSPLPGLLFPVGLLILAVALFRKQAVAPWAGLLLAAGAILFPVGRIPGLVWAIFACDVLLTVSLGYIGWRVLSTTAAEWERGAEVSETLAAPVIAG
jgi:hypothetical protein